MYSNQAPTEAGTIMMMKFKYKIKHSSAATETESCNGKNYSIPDYKIKNKEQISSLQDGKSKNKIKN